MIQRGSIPGLTQESGARGLVAIGGPEHLERDFAVESRVMCQEHHTHFPAAEKPLDLVGTQRATRLQPGLRVFGILGERRIRDFGRRLGEETLDARLVRQERYDLPAQRLVTVAVCVQEGVPMVSGRSSAS